MRNSSAQIIRTATARGLEWPRAVRRTRELHRQPRVSVLLAPSALALPVWAGSVAHARTRTHDRGERQRERERAVLWTERGSVKECERGRSCAERACACTWCPVGRRGTSVFNGVSLVNQTRVTHSWNWLKTQDKNISKLVKFLLRMFY